MARRLSIGCLFAALMAAHAGLAPGEAAAQSGPRSFFGMFGAAAAPVVPAAAPAVAPLAYADPGVARAQPAAPMGSATAITVTPAPEPAPAETAFCVRLCDGRHFPLTSGGIDGEAKTCSAMCPASRTRVFRGASIEAAVATEGARYASLANAFLYRKQLVTGCTCNGKDALGLARQSIASDPTLRAGDVVATAQGLKVFRGGAGTHHRTADFTPIKRGAVPDDVRRKLVGLRVVKN